VADLKAMAEQMKPEKVFAETSEATIVSMNVAPQYHRSWEHDDFFSQISKATRALIKSTSAPAQPAASNSSPSEPVDKGGLFSAFFSNIAWKSGQPRAEGAESHSNRDAPAPSGCNGIDFPKSLLDAMKKFPANKHAFVLSEPEIAADGSTCLINLSSPALLSNAAEAYIIFVDHTYVAAAVTPMRKFI
jgi:hypothetical protein